MRKIRVKDIHQRIFKKTGSILRHFKIQHRLIFFFLLISLLPLIITGLISYNRSSNAIYEKIGSNSVQTMNQLEKTLAGELQKIVNDSKEITLTAEFQEKLSDYDTNENLTETSALKKYLQESLVLKYGLNESIGLVQIITPSNKSLYTGSPSLLSGADLDALIKSATTGEGKAVWLEPSNMGGEIYITMVKTINSLTGNAPLGTFILLLKEDFIKSIYKDIDLGAGSSIFILDTKGLVISSYNEEIISIASSFPEKKLTEKVVISSKSDDKTFSETIQGEMNLIVNSYLKECDWYIVAAIPYNYLNSESKSIGKTILLVGFISVVLSVLLSVIIANSISKPLSNLVLHMEEAKKGNLAIKIIDCNKDEISEATHNYSDMITNFCSLIIQVNTAARNVLDNSAKVHFSSDCSYTALEQIATTIQQIAQGATEQAGEAEDGVMSMNKLSAGINEVGNYMDTISQIIGNTKSLRLSSQASVEFLSQKAAETSTVTEKIVSEINHLNQDIKEIKNIVKVISDITDQTNLLSLNAAIEAARAGNAGRGFAVVADRIKKLADETKEASALINRIISNIMQKTERTVKAAADANLIVNQQIGAVNETDTALETIFEAMDGITVHMESISGSVKEIMTSKEVTMATIENISAVSEEAAAAVEEVSASTEQQMAGAEELAGLSRGLNDLALMLNEAVSQFKTE